jgi:DNA-binding transcriptional LysR family regulator
MIRNDLGTSLSSILAFVRTCELGNFSRAAQSLHVTPAAVSRSVARLEADFGVRLFQRSTRALVQTQAGQWYFERCAQALQVLSDAQRGLKFGHAIKGRVRCSIPSTFGLHVLMPTLGELQRSLPEVELEIQVSNESVDFVREGFDLAVRMGQIEDASLVARKLKDCSVGVFASPGYLKTRPAPKTPSDVTSHRCIAFVLPKSGRLLPWIFSGHADLVPKRPLKVLGDPMGLVAAGVGGSGLFQGYHFLVQRQLASGQLREVLSDYAGRVRPFSLVHLKEATRAPAVKAVADWILKTARSLPRDSR